MAKKKVQITFGVVVMEPKEGEDDFFPLITKEYEVHEPDPKPIDSPIDNKPDSE